MAPDYDAYVPNDKPEAQTPPPEDSNTGDATVASAGENMPDTSDPETAPATRKDLDALRQALEEKRAEDARRFYQPESQAPPLPPAAPVGMPMGPVNPTPQQLAQWQQQNPDAYAQWMIQRIAQGVNEQVQQRQEGEAIVAQYREKYPHLTPFEADIRRRANEFAVEAQRRHEKIDVKAIVEKSVAEYEQRYQKLLAHTQQQAAAEQMKRNALAIDVGQEGQPNSAIADKFKDLDTMSDAEFYQFKQQLKAKGQLPR